MSEVGKKRPAEEQTPEEGDRQAGEASPKRPAPGFSFRPSPLNKATQGFSLKQSTLLKPASVAPTTSTVVMASSEGSSAEPPTPTGGFLKLSSEEIAPINITTPTIMMSGVGRGATNHMEGDGGRTENHNDVQQENPFLQFLTNTSAPTQSFSSLLNSGRSRELVSSPASEVGNSTSLDDSRSSQDSTGDAAPNSGSRTSDTLEPSTPPVVPFGSQPATALLPEVQTPTGEEGERKIVQIPGRLYVFDAASYNWKERGRGEVRLNDACQGDGVYQSRLVMRQFGSYRVLLNTHLWAQMKCDRANQKSIRITAQHGAGEVSVFLIMGAVKDIQQLFTAVDRRIQALRINLEHSKEKQQLEETWTAVGRERAPRSPEEEEEEVESFLEDPHSSPDSSPDTHLQRLKHVPIPDQPSGTGTEPEPAEGEGENEQGEEKSVDEAADSRLSASHTASIQELPS